MIKHIANIVTGCRLLGGVLLLFFSAFSVEFYIIHIICGLSDMIDGTIARKTNSASEFGSKIDTAADLAFITTSLIKILPKVKFPPWLWIWGGVIAVIKIGNIAWGFIVKKQFVSLHTIMNKITGFLLFLLPLTMFFVQLKYTSIVLCLIATVSALQEGVYMAMGLKIE